jgi:sugar lactone lactonase YvrE
VRPASLTCSFLFAAVVAAPSCLLDIGPLAVQTTSDAGATRCPADQKLCGGRCIDLDSPAHGCKPSSCEACDVPRAVAACVNAECAVASCESGYADCDGQRGNGCELRTTSDSLNCGRCGRSCLGAACQDGRCAPIILASATEPFAVAVDGEFVFYTATDATGELCRVPKNGGSVESLSTEEADPRFVALDETHVYWTNYANGSVRRARKDGSSRETLRGDAGTPLGLALHGDSVYFSDATGGNVWVVAKSGGSARTLATGQATPTAIAVDAEYVYWTNQGEANVRRAPHGSQNVSGEIVGPLNEPLDAGGAGADYSWGIAVDDDNVYWRDDVVGWSPIGGPVGRVMGISKSGGRERALVSGHPGARFLSLDEEFIYWTNYDSGTVMQARKDGTVAIELARGQSSPHGIATDRDAVYWTNFGAGAILKVAK